MNLVEDIVLYQLGKAMNVNVSHWINTFQCNNNTGFSKRVDLRNITKILSITNTLHNSLKCGRKITLRELYYQNCSLFKNQSQVMKIIQGFIEMLKVPRRLLGLFPSPKGMIGGKIKFTYKDSEVLNVEDSGIVGATITDFFETTNKEFEIKTNMKYLLIIEKASIFQYLMEREIFNRIPCILITGKGFPDISTRKFVSKLVDCLKITAIYLGDFDPHGINIYLTYVRGSNNYESKMAACPNIFYLGIHFEDTIELPNETKMNLSKNDRSVLKALLQDPMIKECKYLHNQCKIMNKKGFKCELEAFQSISSDYLVHNYLPEKILRKSWI